MNPLFVGIDVSLHSNQVLAMALDGTEVDSFQVPNNLPGTQELCRRLADLLPSRQVDHLVIGLEATGLYGWHLQQELHQAPLLQPYKPVVHPFNPKIVAGFKKAYPELPKTDQVDAWLIADRLRFGRLPAPNHLDPQYEALRRLTRTRFHLVQDLTRGKQRFLNALFLKFSSFVQERPVSRLWGTTALAFTVEAESPEQVALTPIGELVDQVIHASRNRFADPQAVAAAVQKAARSSYRLPKALADPVNFELATHLGLIRALQDQLKTLDEAIERLLTAFPNPLGSVKGLGKVYIAGILAEIADIRRFPNHHALAKFAGLAWSRHQSGSFESQNTRLLRTGNRYLRYYLVEAANSLVVHDAEFKRYYQRKKAESKTHAHLRALALTARKLVRLLDALLRSNRLYNPLGAPDR